MSNDSIFNSTKLNFIIAFFMAYLKYNFGNYLFSYDKLVFNQEIIYGMMNYINCNERMEI